MPVRRSILGIDGPRPLARSQRDAQYIADEGLATAAYLALAFAFTPLSAQLLGVLFLIVIGYVVSTEIGKVLFFRRRR